jgi:hypothetical protein
MLSIKLLAAGLLATCFASTVSSAAERWTPEQANAWYAKHRWLIGSNYLPQTAINQLEMWQADTFDPATIDKELGWAESLGMNTMRVFLHDLVWQQDAEGFKKRIDQFLTICQKHKIKPLLVIFDSCWAPYPQLGKQHDPAPGTHNSGWVQSPGQGVLLDESQWPRLKEYVTGVVKAFGQDDRILGWDVWNEPDNHGGGKYPHILESEKVALVGKLLPQVFAWARSENPKQPLTSGPWHNDSWAPGARKLNVVEETQLNQSDVITFHSYDRPEQFEDRIKQLQPYGRPIICTEYMARGNGSTFAGSLPIAVKYNVGMINWGFVLGKSQTNMPWDSWDHPYIKEGPKVWFHDIFYSDGQPYRPAEVDLIKSLTKAADGKFKG